MHRGSVAQRPRVRKTAGPGRLAAVLASACVAAIVASSGVARADPSPADPERLEAAVDKHLGLFLAVPERRERGEGVTLDDHGELEIRFQRSLPAAKRDAFLCQGVRWLLLGRLKKADGVAGLFRALPEVQAATLVFYALETSLQADAQGGYRQERRAVPRARFRIGREKAGSLDPVAVERLLGPETCVSNGRTLLDLLWAPEGEPSP